MTGSDSPNNAELSELVQITISRRSAVMIAALYTEHLHKMHGRNDSARMSLLIAGTARLGMTTEEAQKLHNTMGTLFKSKDCTDIMGEGPFSAVLLMMALTSKEPAQNESETFGENILKQFKDEGLL